MNIMTTFQGYTVYIKPDMPRYVLPEEVIPGVPWPTGFRDEINKWASEFFRPVNVVADNDVMFIGRDMVVNPRTAQRLRDQFMVVRRQLL